MSVEYFCIIRLIEMNRYLKVSVRFTILVFCLITSIQAFSQARGGPTQYRTISVSTQPNATVWLDGVRYGSTGENGIIEIATVPPGAHTLKVRAAGYKEVSQPLTAAQRGEVRVNLVKTTDEAELAFQEGERLASVDRDRSADAFRQAIKLRPKYPDAYLSLARILSDAGELDDAKKVLVAVRRLQPGLAEASAIEGRIHKDNGDEEKAVATFMRAITEGKGFQPEAYTGLGLLFAGKAEAAGGSGNFDLEAQHYAESAKNLKTALKQLAGSPDSMVIYQLLGLNYERQKMNAEAIALYEEFLSLFPNSVEATAVRSYIVQLKKDMSSQ